MANVDLTSEGAFAIYRASDDQLIYKSGKYTTYDHTIAYAPEKSTLQIKPTATSSNNYELKPDTTYYITMGEGFVRFADGSTNPAIVKGEWQFTTGAAEFFSTEASVIMEASDDASRVPVTVTWDDSWFMNSAAMTYNHELARTSMALSGAAYVEDYYGDPSFESIQSALKQFKFDEIKSYNYSYPLTVDDNDHVAYTFAVKRIKHLSDDTTYLVAIVVKGTSGNEEWYSNFNIGTDDTHRGFNLAKTELMKDLEKYLSDLGLTSSYKNSTKFLVTGHSRGAAVANLVAADLSYSSHATASNVYGYTFATPTVSIQARESGYENIFNIISGEDFVTQVPLSGWEFKHYGIDLLLPSKSYYSSGKYKDVYNDMENVFKDEMTGKDFQQYKNGTQDVDTLKMNVYHLAPTTRDFYSKSHFLASSFGTGVVSTATTSQYFGLVADSIVNHGLGKAPSSILLATSLTGSYINVTSFFVENHIMNPRIFSAHSMAGYYSWLKACSAQELFGKWNESTYATFKRLKIACPVDVYVYDNNRIVVASIVDEKIIADTLAVNVENGVKTIDLPNDQEYSIEIVATDEGSVSYTVEELSAEGIGNSTLRTVKFNDIAIDDGDELTGTVNDIMYTDKVNYALTKNDTDTIYADYDSYEQPSVDPIVPVTPTPSYPVGGSVGETVAYTIAIPAVAGGAVTATPKSASKGSTVILTVIPDKGYELLSLSVTDSMSNKLELTDKSNGKYAFEMPNSKVTVEATFQLIPEQDEAQIPQESEAPWVNPFADVAANAWYYDAVKFVSENGLMNGISSNLFTPDANLSRVQLAQILYNKEDKPTVSGNSTFTDVATDAWYSDAVTWAATNGIVGGYGNGLFGPDDNVTREQLAVMLWRYAGEPAANAEVSFSDTNQISDFALAAIRWAVENGILAGKENHILDPKGCTTRAEVAQMLKNYLG